MFRPAIAGPLEDGYAAYRNGDYAAAMNYWRPLAEQHNAVAQVNLGLMYAKASEALAGVTRPFKPKDEPAAYLGELQRACARTFPRQTRRNGLAKGGLGLRREVR